MSQDEDPIEFGAFYRQEVYKAVRGDRSMIDQYVVHLFAQIGNLANLQELHVGVWNFYFRFSDGHLERLSDLRQLRKYQ